VKYPTNSLRAPITVGQKTGFVNIKPKVSYGELQHVKPHWYNQLYIHTRNIPSTQQENTCMIRGLRIGVYPQNAQIPEAMLHSLW
jgi:hypothetical protein